MKRKHVLVLGGAGYIGSHFVQYARDAGLTVTVVDNLSKGHRAAVPAETLVIGDLRDPLFLRRHLSAKRYDGILHFAASCYVGESVANPAHYYENNVISAFNILEAMRETGHDRLVFSSSCAVYGIPKQLPLKEDHPKAPISPYGRTKLAIEWMLEDYYVAYGIRSASLRYFNAAGCEADRGLGEDHRPETHLIPNAVRCALGMDTKLTIFGDDYPTTDGTCIRDYIHVVDLADAHLKALEKLEDSALLRLNLGTGQGYSNKQVVSVVSKLAGISLCPVIGSRRPGDPAELVADASEAQRVLQWRPVRSDLESMVAETLTWISRNPTGYPDLRP